MIPASDVRMHLFMYFIFHFKEVINVSCWFPGFSCSGTKAIEHLFIFFLNRVFRVETNRERLKLQFAGSDLSQPRSHPLGVRNTPATPAWEHLARDCMNFVLETPLFQQPGSSVEGTRGGWVTSALVS